MVEDAKLKVKECDCVASVLEWKYFEKLIAAVPCSIYMWSINMVSITTKDEFGICIKMN